MEINLDLKIEGNMVNNLIAKRKIKRIERDDGILTIWLGKGLIMLNKSEEYKLRKFLNKKDRSL